MLTDFVVSLILLGFWVAFNNLVWLPRFREFVVALKAADKQTWISIGSPDGSFFGSPVTPTWGLRLRRYLVRKQYIENGDAHLISAATRLRSINLVGRITFVSVFIAAVIKIFAK